MRPGGSATSTSPFSKLRRCSLLAMARSAMKISPLPPAFEHSEYSYRSSITPTITISPPTPSSRAGGPPAPSFHTVDVSDEAEKQTHDAASSYKTLLALAAASSFLSLAYQRAVTQYREYSLIADSLTPAPPAAAHHDYLPLHHTPPPQPVRRAPCPPRARPLTAHTQTEPAAPVPPIEERLVAWAGPDVRAVIGHTAYTLATAGDAHTPFAGGAAGTLLQDVYAAFRAEGTCLLGRGQTNTELIANCVVVNVIRS
ncbi:hypothetical protein PHLGIDRAFT_236328 [Phlebiopsis gigantea 11061_1 CR5-6]|uniref:Uncharacterized protein n=1 Tax=Phlebiopsis gigantea (strain 11061_1 CR5-6) TaxID=745531 RepID=A0A0C3RST9_PHLG1|nr:hypothetical protein PHLGIDRAFT_236328 [Phlebiopsis gigantea 11061_1 CR5-6]